MVLSGHGGAGQGLGSWDAEACVLENWTVGSPCRDIGMGEGTRTPLWEAVTSLQEWRIVKKMLGLRLLEPDRSRALVLVFSKDCLYASPTDAAMVTVTEIRCVPAVPEWVPVFLMRPGERLCMRGRGCACKG